MRRHCQRDTPFFFSGRRRHTISKRDWSSDVCSSDLGGHRAMCSGGDRKRRTAVTWRGDRPRDENSRRDVGKRLAYTFEERTKGESRWGTGQGVSAMIQTAVPEATTWVRPKLEADPFVAGQRSRITVLPA